jgi:Flp pilus assembly protein TadD
MDAGILYESGTLQELLAGRPSLQTLPMLSRGDATAVSVLRVEGAVREMRQRRAVRLEAAAKWLRAAAEIDPSSLNARLHLARVVMLRGDDESALTSFNELRRAPGAPALIVYRASLFAGAVHERRGRLQEAADAYSAATLIVPNSQTAHVALSAALQRAGRGDEARAALAAVMNNSGQEPVDTAWTYFFDVSEVATARLDQLRAEAWK